MANEDRMEELQAFLRELVDSGTPRDAVALLLTQHPADQADLIEQLNDEDREQLLDRMPSDRLAAVLEYLNEDLRADLLAELSADDVARLLNQLDDDVTADIIQDLDEEQAEQVMPLLEFRQDVEEILSYPEESAGGRMSGEFVSLKTDWTVQDAIEFLREQHPDTEQPFYLYVVDADEKLQGILPLRSLITGLPQMHIGELASRNIQSVRADEDQEVAAERMRHYNLLALPVVDSQGALVGVITADNILDIQVEEATEDMFKMAGVGVKEWAFSPVWESAGRRIPWLAFNMTWAFAGAIIISVFEGTLEQVAALAIFMPMIAGQAGNAAIQTATIMVRSMALGEVQFKDGWRVLRKEWILGLIKGVIFGSALGLIAWLWQDHLAFGLIAGAAMFLNMFVASTTGVILPLTLRKLGIDPATIAGVFDTMITDFMGFLIYLGLATIFIARLT